MNEQQFWKIIDASRDAVHGNRKAHIGSLRKQLRALSHDEVEQFEKLFVDIEGRARRPELQDVATAVMGGFCSDDAFWDFRYWLISKGRAAYKAALRDPKSVLELADDDTDDCRFEEFGYVAIDVLEEKQRKQRRRNLTDTTRPTHRQQEGAHHAASHPI